MVFVARDHNNELLGWNRDLGNLMEEVMLYEEITGNKATVAEETIDLEKL